MFMRHVKKWGGGVLDALLPPQCLTCDAPVSEQGSFCAGCFGSAVFITEPCCIACGRPFSHAAEGGRDMICQRCFAEPPAWRQSRAALLYDAHSRKIVLSLKHGDRTDLAQALGGMMARAGVKLLAEADLVVPVPLHPAKLRARRYNQAALLARDIGRRSATAVCVDLLVRTRATLPLGDLSAEHRAAMMDGAIGVRRGRGNRLLGQHVLLIDDVLTTGATAGACARALLGSGAAQVDVLVAARVPDPRDALG